jgi:GGDEF domain-containing protein
MKKFLNILVKILSTYDYLYIVIIVFSFASLLYLEDGSWKIIAISMGILFIVALISSVVQKFIEFYENNPASAFNQQYEYEITTQSSEIGKRQTIENFDKADEFEKVKDEDANSEEKKSIQEEKNPIEQISRIADKTIDDQYPSVRIIKRIKQPIISNEEENDKSQKQQNEATQSYETSQASINEKAEKAEDRNNDNISKIKNETPTEKESESNANPLTINKSNETDIDITENRSEKVDFIQPNKSIENQPESVKTSEIITEEHKNYNKVEDDFKLSAFFETHPLFGNEPKKELEYFVNRILMIIKSTISANTIAVLLSDNQRKGLRLYSYITENESYINKTAYIPLNSNILSEIVFNSKPEILSNINYAAVMDIFPYYNHPIEIKSFAGIPIFHKQEVIGVLIIDSFENNVFDGNIIGYVGNFTKVLSSLLTSLTEKYDHFISSKILKALDNYRQLLSEEDLTFSKIINKAFATIQEIFGFKNIGYCNYSSQHNKWQVQAIQGDELFVKSLNNANVDLHKAEIKVSLLDNKVLFLSPIKDRKHLISESEQFTESGYFLSVPLKSLTSNYGAMFIYGNESNNISEYDLTIIKSFAEQVASIIEKFLYIKIYTNFAQNNPTTGILTPNAFLQRFKEENLRSNALHYPIAYIAISIDNFEQYANDTILAETLVQYQIDYLKSKIKDYDLIGHIDDNTIGLIIINTTSSELKIWLEKLRTEIASKFVKFDSKRFTITFSVGAALSSDKDTLENIYNNMINMLNEASKKSNTVCIYER